MESAKYRRRTGGEPAGLLLNRSTPLTTSSSRWGRSHQNLDCGPRVTVLAPEPACSPSGCRSVLFSPSRYWDVYFISCWKMTPSQISAAATMVIVSSTDVVGFGKKYSTTPSMTASLRPNEPHYGPTVRCQMASGSVVIGPSEQPRCVCCTSITYKYLFQFPNRPRLPRNRRKRDQRKG